MLRVNRSTYYQFLNHTPSKRDLENQKYRKLILEIYIQSKKRLGTRKIKVILLRDYGVKLSEGRIYRLMKTMALPKMSTFKPHNNRDKQNPHQSPNLLKQQFNPTALIKFGQLISLIFLLVLRNLFIFAPFLIYFHEK